ncbi:MAG: carbohydrate kinase family protein [Pseudomonadota bacterium]
MRGVAVVGSLTSDVVAGAAPRVGGAPYYAAGALRLLGRPSLIVTRCAPADRPMLLPRLVALGTPVEWLPAERTYRYRFDYRGSRREMTVEDVAEPWRPGPWLDLLRPYDAVHVGALAVGEFPAETVAALARGRRVVSLDGQGLVRAAATGPLRLEPHADPAILRHVSILKLSEEEATALVGGTDAASLRGLGVPEVLVTHGDRGSTVHFHDTEEHVPALAVHAADPTGAGDAFAVAYLVSRTSHLAPGAAARRATSVVAELLARRR